MSNDSNSLLNAVKITSNVRTQGEYKYYYCGEQATENSEKDNSFFAVASIWYTTKISEYQILFASTYNKYYTAQLFFNNKKDDKSYTLYVYQNIIDKETKLFNLKLYRVINFPIPKRFDKQILNENQNDVQPVKIFICANNFVLVNDINLRIIIIDFNNGNYITIIENPEKIEQSFNIIDVYDEEYFNGRTFQIITYVFVLKTVKKDEYQYQYFLVKKGNLCKKQFFLHNLEIELDKRLELKSIKIAKIHNEGKWFYIMCFFAFPTLYQIVTDYSTFSLSEYLKKFKILNEEFRKTNTKKVEMELVNEANSESHMFLIINRFQICGLAFLFGGNKIIVSCPFYYNDTPEIIRKKIFLSDNFNKKDQKSDLEKNLEVYKFSGCYDFKKKVRFSYHMQNIIVANNQKFYIFERYNSNDVYNYEFYDETLSLFLTFESLNSTFLLTANKCFVVIYNRKLEMFKPMKICKASPYKYPSENQKLDYPKFEYDPKEIFNNYKNATLESLSIPKIPESARKDKKGLIKCDLCGRDCEKNAMYNCDKCNKRFYCSKEHLKYDDDIYHFFECAMIRFFNREDIFDIDRDDEKNYMLLYNELIRMFQEMLYRIFMQIEYPKDYQVFLQFIVTIANIMNSFGFHINLEEYASTFIFTTSKPKVEKIVFYMECIFFYYQIYILQCKFALKSKLYNLTDCYLQIIKNELIPKFQLPLKVKPLSLPIQIEQNYFSFIESGLFFHIDKNCFDNEKNNNNTNSNTNSNINSNNNSISELVQKKYFIRLLESLSLIAKFKTKIGSTINIKEIFLIISYLFEEHFKISKQYSNCSFYAYFCICYYLVEEGKISQTVRLLRRMINSFKEETNKKLKVLCHYNLGLLQYALGFFPSGVHNLETSYKLIVEYELSSSYLFTTLETLALAYLNQRSLFKSYVLIQTSIQERKKIRTKENELKCIKLKAYLNYIIDLYEYSFIKRARQPAKKPKHENKFQLVQVVLGQEERDSIISEQNIDQFMRLVHFMSKLSKELLTYLQSDNPPRPAVQTREDNHFDKSNSFNDTSQNSTFIGRDKALEKDENPEEYDEYVEFKPTFFDSLSTKLQAEFKQIKSRFLKRDNILRDPRGKIEKFNLNYHPIYTEEFKCIIDKLKCNFLLKEISNSFQSKKDRDEHFNYNSNCCLLGLSKYLKLEEIQNMLVVERSKFFDSLKREKNHKGGRSSFFGRKIEQDIYPDSDMNNNNIECKTATLRLSIPEKDDYLIFKQKFEELIEDNRYKEVFSYLNSNEDYLKILYYNVFKNNPDQEYIFKNPMLILNYIFTELEKNEVLINPISPSYQEAKTLTSFGGYPTIRRDNQRELTFKVDDPQRETEHEHFEVVESFKPQNSNVSLNKEEHFDFNSLQTSIDTIKIKCKRYDSNDLVRERGPSDAFCHFEEGPEDNEEKERRKKEEEEEQENGIDNILSISRNISPLNLEHSSIPSNSTRNIPEESRKRKRFEIFRKVQLQDKNKENVQTISKQEETKRTKEKKKKRNNSMEYQRSEEIKNKETEQENEVYKPFLEYNEMNKPGYNTKKKGNYNMLDRIMKCRNKSNVQRNIVESTSQSDINNYVERDNKFNKNNNLLREIRKRNNNNNNHNNSSLMEKDKNKDLSTTFNSTKLNASSSNELNKSDMQRIFNFNRALRKKKKQ